MFSKNLILSLIDKETAGTKRLALFICIAATSWTGGLEFGLAGILGAIDISDIIHSFYHDKSSSISQLIIGK